MYKVILVNGVGEQGNWILRQTHNQSGISRCGKYQFFVNEDIPDPDFVVIRGKSIKTAKTYHVAPENMILATSEPYSVLAYPKSYHKQFGAVLSCQDGLKHKKVFYSPAIIFWFVGAVFGKGKHPVTTYSYDDFKTMPTPQKTKLISVITSNKGFTQGHLDRITFVEKLKTYYGDKLDIYGRGYRSFDDKWDVIAPYKFHIAIENSASKYYWTEKLSDSYLAETFPIYYGCTNINDYFPEDSYATIDIHDFEGSVKVIDKILEDNNFYSDRQAVLRKSKELVLEDYNLFNYIASCLDELNPNLPKQDITIKPANSIGCWHNFYLYMIERNLFKLKQTLKALFGKKSILAEK